MRMIPELSLRDSGHPNQSSSSDTLTRPLLLHQRLRRVSRSFSMNFGSGVACFLKAC